MRDYKHVKVPRSYRTDSKRTSVKRVNVNRTPLKPQKTGGSFLTMLMSVMMAIVIAGSCYLAWQTYQTVMHADMFVVSGVDITGIKRLEHADLKSLAESFTGQNIFRVDMASAVRRAHANPWVKEARIYRKLPNRITITVEERTPTLLVDAGNNRYLADSDGYIIERMEKGRSGEWPFPVIAVRDHGIKPGEQVMTEAMREAMDVIGEIALRGGWRPSEIVIKASSPEALSIVYAGNEFKIGSGRHGEKLRRLSEVLADIKERGIEFTSIDLRPERQVAVMMKKTGVKGQAPGARKKRSA